MKRIDLNVDIGEGFPFDDGLLEFATSANVGLGEHAGSWELTLATVEKCRARGVRVGAHPGFPDRAGMGREDPAPDGALEAMESVRSQVERFRSLGPAYVKPHGALYHLVAGGAAPSELVGLAVAFAYDVVHRYELPLMLLPVGPVAKMAQIHGRLIREGFADRAYLPDGHLAKRGTPGAVLHDPAEIRAQVVKLAESVDSICLHGDTPGCLEFAEQITRTLRDAGYEVGA